MGTLPGSDLSQQSQTVFPQAQQPQGQGKEPSASDPQIGTADEPQNSGGLTPDDQTKLIALVRRYKDMWSQDRLILMQRCIENLEFFKGNQFISFGGGNASFFDSTDWIGQANGNSKNSDDKDLYQYCNNFYQMLATGFVAALSPQVPKSKWMPEDAEQLIDTTTAKAAQTLISIIEEENKEASLLKLQLFYLYTTGAVFRHTRYTVDADRWGTKAQPVFNETDTQIMPDRMHCFNCGTDNHPAAPTCQGCQQPMGQDSFFPAQNGPVSQQVGTEQVPKGMVAQDLYCPLEVDVDPRVRGIGSLMLKKTPILNLDVEVHLADLRNAYPDMYSQIQSSATSELSTNGTIDRIARQQVFSQTAGNQNVLSDMSPTLSRTWIQPWAFALEDDQVWANRMKQMFPTGVLLVNTGETFLNASEASLTKEWTWAGTHEGLGLYPPSIGDIVVPFQKRYNDMANIIHEFMDRCSAGVILANADLIGSKSMQGKPLMPGVWNIVKLTKSAAPGSQKLADALYQMQFQMQAEAFSYLDKLAVNAQMFAGVPPQVYGGEGDENIQTFGGQQQQLNTALGKLNLYWDSLKDEHAKADELAIECAKDNLTDDMRQVIQEKGSEFRNDYVRLDDLQGSIHAYADTDQGLPVTAAELRERWMNLLEEAGKENPVALSIFDDPSNQEQAAKALGVPSMVVPGEAMRSKTLQIIEKLLGAEPIPQTNPQTGQPIIDPNTGQPQIRPSILPDKDIDDFKVLKATVRQYCQENFDVPDENPAGWQNLLAYFTAAVAMETQFNIQQAQSQGAAQGAGQMAAAPPPKPPPQLSPDEQKLLGNVRQDEATALQDLITIAQTPPLAMGESLQAQTAAAGKLLDFATKAEQLAADKTAPQG